MGTFVSIWELLENSGCYAESLFGAAINESRMGTS
jgi:hypothetical protein